MDQHNHRRTWNLQEYQSRDKEEPVKKGKVIKKKHYSSNHGLELKNKLKVGKVNIVNPTNLKNQFYCSICDVLKHDSISYLCHLNSKGHNKNIGKGLTVERSSISKVKERLNSKNQDKDVSKKQTGTKSKQKCMEPALTPDLSEMKDMMGFCSFGKN